MHGEKYVDRDNKERIHLVLTGRVSVYSDMYVFIKHCGDNDMSPRICEIKKTGILWEWCLMSLLLWKCE
jgi:hypothetical protein